MVHKYLVAKRLNDKNAVARVLIVFTPFIDNIPHKEMKIASDFFDLHASQNSQFSPNPSNLGCIAVAG